MATSELTQSKVKRPALLRVIFILNLLLIIACGIIYYQILNNPEFRASVGGMNPNLILTNGIIYIVTFLIMEIAGYKRKFAIMLSAFAIDVIVSVVIVFAPIGILIGLLSIGLSFTKPVRRYFKA